MIVLHTSNRTQNASEISGDAFGVEVDFQISILFQLYKRGLILESLMNADL